MSGRSKIVGTLILFTLLPGLSLFPGSGRLSGQDIQPGEPESWTFYWENDSFLFRGTDRYYTNGIRLVRSFGADGLPRWAHRTRWIENVVDRMPLCPANPEEGRCFTSYQTAWTFGQSLYTPENLRTPRLLLNQRPYGAWLYYGNILTLDKPGQQQTWEIDVGAVGGSLALGETVQRGWHDLRRELGIETLDPKGWDNQLNNQLGLQVHFQNRWQLAERFDRAALRYFDLVPQANVSFGTVSVHGGVGATARFGYNLKNEFTDVLPSFIPAAPPSADPAAPAEEPPGRALASLRRPAPLARPAPRPERRWEAYVFAGAHQRFVAYSVFLDGNIRLFGKSHSVPKEPLVTDLLAGAALGRGRWRLSATWVDRSPEFKAQRDHQRFISLALSRRY